MKKIISVIAETGNNQVIVKKRKNNLCIPEIIINTNDKLTIDNLKRRFYAEYGLKVRNIKIIGKIVWPEYKLKNLILVARCCLLYTSPSPRD